jgi:hypothetical protein
MIYDRTIEQFNGLVFTDEVYANGEIVRVDKDASQCADLIAEYNMENVIWCGVTSPYKIYKNPTVSFYKWGACPNGVESTWHGVKIDTVTGEILYKINTGSKSLTYLDTEIIAVDYYYSWTPAEAQEYCQQNGLSYPISSDIEDEVWIWGVSCDLNETPETVKAYRWVR